jgi:hypothetical protein
LAAPYRKAGMHPECAFDTRESPAKAPRPD